MTGVNARSGERPTLLLIDVTCFCQPHVRLIADRVSIPAWVRAGLEHLGIRLQQYSFSSTHSKVPRLGNLNFEAGIFEIELCFPGKARFDFYRLVSFALPPRRLDGLLNIHAEIDDIR